MIFIVNYLLIQLLTVIFQDIIIYYRNFLFFIKISGQTLFNMLLSTQDLNVTNIDSNQYLG